MEATLAWVSAFADHGVALFGLLFALAFANVFVPPVPIETISVFVGYLTSIGHGHAISVWLALATGMAVGSTLLYYLARTQEHNLFRLKVISKQVTPSRLAKVEVWFQQRGVWIIYAGKLVPGMSFATVLASGLFGAHPRQALPAIYMANLVYFAVSVALGRIMGERWQEGLQLAKTFWPWLAVILITVGVTYALVRRSRRKHRSKQS